MKEWSAEFGNQNIVILLEEYVLVVKYKPEILWESRSFFNNTIIFRGSSFVVPVFLKIGTIWVADGSKLIDMHSKNSTKLQ